MNQKLKEYVKISKVVTRNVPQKGTSKSSDYSVKKLVRKPY